MNPQIIISLAAVFGLFHSSRITNVFSRSITLIQVLAITIALFPFSIAKTIGFYLFALMILISTIYVLTRKIDLGVKSLMLLIIVPVFIRFVFVMQHWPFANEIRLLMSLPIIAYLILLTRKNSVKNEIGFLTIIAAEALVQFLVIISFWLHLD